jgi:hypothetical protein
MVLVQKTLDELPQAAASVVFLLFKITSKVEDHIKNSFPFHCTPKHTTGKSRKHQPSSTSFASTFLFSQDTIMHIVKVGQQSTHHYSLQHTTCFPSLPTKHRSTPQAKSVHLSYTSTCSNKRHAFLPLLYNTIVPYNRFQ